MRYTLLGLLLIAMACGCMAEASYACFEASEDLEPCNFERIPRTPVKSNANPETKVSNGAVMESLYQAPDGTVVVYKLEGCIPGRLPFTLPKCKTEDKIGKPVEVRRLFPFVIAGDPPTAPLIFPEVEAAKLYKSSGDLKEEVYDPVVSRDYLNEQIPAKVSKKKKKKLMMMEDLIGPVRKQKSMDFDSMFTKFLGEQRKRDFFKTKHHKQINEVVETENLKKSINRNDFDESPGEILETRSDDNFERHTIAGSDGGAPKIFPYEKAVLIDPIKFSQLMTPPYIFPYEVSVPYDPALLHRRVHKVKRENRYTDHSKYITFDQLSLHDQVNLVRMLGQLKKSRGLEGRATGDEVNELMRKWQDKSAPKYFPYETAVLYNPVLHGYLTNDEGRKGALNAPSNHHHHHEVRPPKIFPYEKSIPYDPRIHGHLSESNAHNSWIKQQKDWTKTDLLKKTTNSMRNHHHDIRPPKFLPVRFDDSENSESHSKQHSKSIFDKNEKSMMEVADNKLQKRAIADEGSEFPYNKALPYNHWKVSEFRRRIEAQSRSLRQDRSAKELL